MSTKLLHKYNQSVPARLIALLCLAAGTGCTAMTQPEDIAVADELCAKRGGYTYVKRSWDGGSMIIVCKDGTHIDVRPGERRFR
jgi:hypothetical protein